MTDPRNSDEAEHVGAPPADEPLNRAERNRLERERLLAALASGRTSTLQERVAWILNQYPDARDSDIILQLRYWQTYEPAAMGEVGGNLRAMLRMTRLTSLARARAKIQNTHRLFQARVEVRRRRGQLSEEERVRHAEEVEVDPTITVYADDSGRTGGHLIVGSIWFLDSTDVVTVYNRAEQWRRESGFTSEFHFSELRQNNLERYIQFLELVLASAPSASFKSISVPRAGVAHVSHAYNTLFFELLRRGVQHEHVSGRAPLPRRLMLWKDAEEAGADALQLADVMARMRAAAAGEFANRLHVDQEFEAIDSRTQILIQLADLYAGSINRVLARQATSQNPKDIFADHLLARIRNPGGEERFGVRDQEQDLEVALAL
jgi:hypothetical protein